MNILGVCGVTLYIYKACIDDEQSENIVWHFGTYMFRGVHVCIYTKLDLLRGENPQMHDVFLTCNCTAERSRFVYIQNRDISYTSSFNV